jgi:transcriptional regulator with XRE-family HTH domain
MQDSSSNKPDGSQLGAALREAREWTQLSARKAAQAAEISPTYLFQLEAGEVRDPSPRVLRRLAEAYAIPGTSASELYAYLMIAAGYEVPGMMASYNVMVGRSPMEQELKEVLTPEERDALIDYLAWYRSRHGRKHESR